MAAAQIFEGAGKPMREAILPLPSASDIEPGEVLVKIELATICGSDLHIIAGHREQPTPAVLGHEAVGVVIASARDDLSPGARVSWSIVATCGACVFCCRHDLPQKCPSLFKYGHSKMSDKNGRALSGCFASHILLRRGTHIVAVPDEMSAEIAAPANCALSTMIYAVSLLPKTCESVVIQGAGMLGVYGCALLTERGVRVFCVDIERARLAMVERFGGEPVLAGMTKQTVLSRYADGVDAVIETAGSADVIAEGASLLRKGGKYLLVGALLRESRLSMITAEQLIRNSMTIRGVHNYMPRHLDESIAFLSRCGKKYPFADLVGAPFALADLPAAVEAAFARRWHRTAVLP